MQLLKSFCKHSSLMLGKEIFLKALHSNWTKLRQGNLDSLLHILVLANYQPYQLEVFFQLDSSLSVNISS